ncbi:GmrSD restriction endonuclease domain-containing protein [Holdemanella biformis]|uniref:GmrSD restriction endonuclease domain-containing protein n=1 Tax=Holdemanella biformis TaxID=1735 RepID=UPI00242C1E5B|nr:DUF262 domain-containing protein [Holdemanella biformis]MBS6454210.1 DUF262 domain-containing protein [Holdemanella biformis]
MSQQLFKNVPYDLRTLLNDVNIGRIGLPDLQRPFVWKDNKIRELLDSMIKGFPIGYIMLWESPQIYDSNKSGHIGIEAKKIDVPKSLVIDGQQRLTALLGAIYGIKVKDKDYNEKNIRISYNPIKVKFEVWSQAYDRDPEWISQISDVFSADLDHALPSFRKKYIREYNASREKNGLDVLSDEEEDMIESNLNRLLELLTYNLPVMEISDKASEEDVSDIFVRVNSGGAQLTEKNFIETLLAVYDNDIFKKINKFCEDSHTAKDGTSFNNIIVLEPSFILRTTIALAFKRARLKYAYMLLRGKDLKTGEFAEDIREDNLKLFRDKLNLVMDLNNWHSYLNLYAQVGYLNSSLISSNISVVYSYALYLIGKYDYKVKSIELQDIIKKWIFMTTITSFFSNSTETTFEKILADLREVKSDKDFIDYLSSQINNKLTDDFFNVTLPELFKTSGNQSPAWFGFVASIIVLDVPILFGTTTLAHFFVPGINGSKKATDKHHIFPKNYLAKQGITDDRIRNQTANFTYLDYQTNIDIGDDAPIEYVSRYKEKLGEYAYNLTLSQNAIPIGFENMSYEEFLEKRRQLMSNTIKEAFKKIS